MGAHPRAEPRGEFADYGPCARGAGESRLDGDGRLDGDAVDARRHAVRLDHQERGAGRAREAPGAGRERLFAAEERNGDVLPAAVLASDRDAAVREQDLAEPPHVAELAVEWDHDPLGEVLVFGAPRPRIENVDGQARVGEATVEGHAEVGDAEASSGEGDLRHERPAEGRHPEDRAPARRERTLQVLRTAKLDLGDASRGGACRRRAREDARTCA